MHDNCRFLIYGAKQSQDCMKQWLRYLRKFVTDSGLALTEEDFAYLMKSDELSKPQKEILQRAKDPASATHKYLVMLNQKTQLWYVKALKRRIHHEQ